jgi:hypothetical protein
VVAARGYRYQLATSRTALPALFLSQLQRGLHVFVVNAIPVVGFFLASGARLRTAVRAYCLLIRHIGLRYQLGARGIRTVESLPSWGVVFDPLLLEHLE